MTHLAPILVAAALSGIGQAPAAAPPARANLWVDVTALDRREMPVVDLKPEEFELWIGGYRIPITDVVAVTPESREGRTVVVILDNVAADPTQLPRVREAARLLIDKVGPNDRMAVIPLQGGVTSLAVTGDRSQLLRTVESYYVQGFPFRIEDAGEQVLRTVTAVSRQLAEVSDARKTIVAIGTGWLFDTPLPPLQVRDLGPAWIEAMRALGSTHTTLYVIDPVGLTPAPRGYFGGASGFARESGGYAFTHTNDLRGVVERIWRESETYYRLGVLNPPVQRTADLREVEVKVLRKGVTVRSRRAIPGKP
jgi:VWFA-related protein